MSEPPFPNCGTHVRSASSSCSGTPPPTLSESPLIARREHPRHVLVTASRKTSDVGPHDLSRVVWARCQVPSPAGIPCRAAISPPSAAGVPLPSSCAEPNRQFQRQWLAAHMSDEYNSPISKQLCSLCSASCRSIRGDPLNASRGSSDGNSFDGTPSREQVLRTSDLSHRSDARRNSSPTQSTRSSAAFESRRSSVTFEAKSWDPSRFGMSLRRQSSVNSTSSVIARLTKGSPSLKSFLTKMSGGTGSPQSGRQDIDFESESGSCLGSSRVSPRRRASIAEMSAMVRVPYNPDSAEGAKARATKRAQLIEEQVMSELKLRNAWRKGMGPDACGLKAEVAKNRATQRARQSYMDFEATQALRRRATQFGGVPVPRLESEQHV